MPDRDENVNLDDRQHQHQQEEIARHGIEW
jgi:hypothetical protein